MTPRVFFTFSICWASAICAAPPRSRALERHGLTVAFVAGGEPVPGLDLGAARPGSAAAARAGDSGFGSSSMTAGADRRCLARRRRAALLSAFERCAPEVVLIELYPFGRRPFRFELRPLLDAAAGGDRGR